MRKNEERITYGCARKNTDTHGHVERVIVADITCDAHEE